MSVIDHAKDELKRIKFGDEDSAVMIDLLDRFLDQWDSGGAVSIASDIFQRLLAYQPLSPLTGSDNEWVDHGHFKQNKRCSTVFKDPDGKTYDIATGPRVPIIFPYDPVTRRIEMPVYEIKTDG